MLRDLTREETLKIAQGKIKPEYKVVAVINGKLRSPSGHSTFEVGKVTISDSGFGFGIFKDKETAEKYINSWSRPKNELALIAVYPITETKDKRKYSEVYTIEVIKTVKQEGKKLITANDIWNELIKVVEPSKFEEDKVTIPKRDWINIKNKTEGTSKIIRPTYNEEPTIKEQIEKIASDMLAETNPITKKSQIEYLVMLKNIIDKALIKNILS